MRIERSEIDCLQGSPKGRSGGDCQSGVFGYYLHRKLESMGVSNLVVQPQDWDERDKGVNSVPEQERPSTQPNQNQHHDRTKKSHFDLTNLIAGVCPKSRMFCSLSRVSARHLL